jgi:hypothetical protein
VIPAMRVRKFSITLTVTRSPIAVMGMYDKESREVRAKVVPNVRRASDYHSIKRVQTNAA